FIASHASPFASSGRERSNLNRPLRDWFITALTSRSTHLPQRGHHSCVLCLGSSLCATWSLSPHLAHSVVVPLVSRFVRWMIGTPLHFALYSTSLWASPKDQEFILPLNPPPWPLPLA